MKLKFLVINATILLLLVCAPVASSQTGTGAGKKDKDKAAQDAAAQCAGQKTAESGDAAEDAEDAEVAEDVQDKNKDKDKDKDKDRDEQKRNDERVAADPAVIVTVCLQSGNITVSGTDRREVRAVTEDDDGRVELRRMDATGETSQATRIEVLIADSPDERLHPGSCNSSQNITLEVPRGATVYLKTNTGDIDLGDVAEVRAETVNGNIIARRVSRSIEAKSVGGDLTLEDSKGRVRLNSISGSVEAANVAAVEAGDALVAKSSSGDVTLDRVGQAHVEASTIGGEIRLIGPLARGGNYDFRTTNGDVTLEMPATSSFQLTAKVSESGEIVTEFPIKSNGGPSPFENLKQGILSGAYGTGDSTIKIISFSGTIRLSKK